MLYSTCRSGYVLLLLFDAEFAPVCRPSGLSGQDTFLIPLPETSASRGMLISARKTLFPLFPVRDDSVECCASSFPVYGAHFAATRYWSIRSAQFFFFLHPDFGNFLAVSNFPKPPFATLTLIHVAFPVFSVFVSYGLRPCIYF